MKEVLASTMLFQYRLTYSKRNDMCYVNTLSQHLITTLGDIADRVKQMIISNISLKW